MSYKYIDIFDDLYQIKDSIPEGIYIKLNNNIKNILTDLDKHCKCSCSSINLNNKNNLLNNIFCSPDNLKTCNNFKLLCLICPQMNYIYDTNQINYSITTNYSKYNHIIVDNIISLLLLLIQMFNNVNNDIYIKYTWLALYNFIIDNYNIFVQYKDDKYKNNFKTIFHNNCNNSSFIELINKHNIIINNWINIFNKI